MGVRDTNLRVLSRSRKSPMPGDIFTMQVPSGEYLFGRVISTEARWTLASGADPAILIYVYNIRSETKLVPDAMAMRPERLLVPPMMTNRLPWSRGLFETIAHRPLESNDLLGGHCFFSGSRNRYYDDAGNELVSPIEPVGVFGLHSFRTIDDEISGALGIPRVP